MQKKAINIKEKSVLKALLKADVVISVIVFVVSAYLFFEIKKIDSGDVYGSSGPAYWPKFILVIADGAQCWSGSLSRSAGVLRGTIAGVKPFHFKVANARFLAAVAIIAVYLILLPYVGFLVLTPLQMIAFMYLLGERQKVWIFTLAFCTDLRYCPAFYQGHVCSPAERSGDIPRYQSFSVLIGKGA